MIISNFFLHLVHINIFGLYQKWPQQDIKCTHVHTHIDLWYGRVQSQLALAEEAKGKPQLNTWMHLHNCLWNPVICFTKILSISLIDFH